MKISKQFPSSSSDAIYTTLLDTSTGASSCNCRGWTFKRDGQERACKHTKKVVAEWAGKPASPSKPVILLGKAEALPIKPTLHATNAQKWAQVSPAEKAASVAALEAEVSAVPKTKGKRSITFEDEPAVAPARPPEATAHVPNPLATTKAAATIGTRVADLWWPQQATPGPNARMIDLDTLRALCGLAAERAIETFVKGRRPS
jgi:hypothetical protein